MCVCHEKITTHARCYNASENFISKLYLVYKNNLFRTFDDETPSELTFI